ncbi:hypothetical protein AAHE18_19G247200 [Arachis hypogaea]
MAPLHFFLILFAHSIRQANGNHENCPSSFTCGNFGTFQYPFTMAEHPECGLLPIQGCLLNATSPKLIQLGNNSKSVNLTAVVETNKIITIYDDGFHTSLDHNECDTLHNNYTLPPPSPSLSMYIKYNVTLFKCNHNLSTKPPSNYVNLGCRVPYGYEIYYDRNNTHPDQEAAGVFSGCSVVQFASKDSTNTKDVLSFVSAEMTLEIVLSHDCDDCFNHRGGLCGVDNNNHFYCHKECSNIQLPLKDESDTSYPFPFVSDEMQLEVLLSDDWAKCVKHQRGQCQLDTQGKFYCATGSSGTNRLVKKMGLALALATLVLVIMTLYYKRWKKQNPTLPLVDAFFERHDHLQIKRYSYSEMKKVTNSFKNKLGQGGFGSVYKGQLQDGRHVAVKILSEFKGDGQEFINEVASMSRTSHVNIVALLGFCFEGSKRALVYELMPNGSLEKLIYNENAVIGDRQLDCQTLYDIAIGVARGLEYLHKGCNTKILHFDIKPHNILLDEKFCPKISDFGLAKVCTRKESIVSIFGARGTAGYIAPEVFSRNFGAVSHKSDVYSYGMMVLEMVGRRKNIKAEVDVSSEIYFPHWIYNRLVSNQELDLQNIRNECDNEMVRKMTIVSLWCIQTNPSTRPSISKVVEMLEGSAELLQLPPKPYWFSPSNSP